MAFTQTFTEQWGGRGTTHGKTGTYTGSGTVSFEETVTTGTTDKEVAFVLDVAAAHNEVELLYIHSDRDISFQTNNGGAPDNTIALTANRPYVWASDMESPCLLTVDVTAAFLTNASGETATVRVEALIDVTP